VNMELGTFDPNVKVGKEIQVSYHTPEEEIT
jgi:hypothetical protein